MSEGEIRVVNYGVKPTFCARLFVAGMKESWELKKLYYYKEAEEYTGLIWMFARQEASKLLLEKVLPEFLKSADEAFTLMESEGIWQGAGSVTIPHVYDSNSCYFIHRCVVAGIIMDQLEAVEVEINADAGLPYTAVFYYGDRVNDYGIQWELSKRGEYEKKE
jgi:hypothetical protein